MLFPVGYNDWLAEEDIMFNRKIKEELSKAKTDLERAEKQLHLLKKDLVERDRVASELESTKKELAEVKKMVRSQIEADILVNAFKAVGIIREEKKEPTQHYFNQQALLQNQLRGLYSQTGQSCGGSFYGDLAAQGLRAFTG